MRHYLTDQRQTHIFVTTDTSELPMSILAEHCIIATFFFHGVVVVVWLERIQILCSLHTIYVLLLEI